MGDAGEHFSALIYGALDAFAHEVESCRGLSNFGRAFGLKIQIFTAFAEVVDGGRQTTNRAHLIAHEYGCDGKQ